jgi:hypothetical protein
MFVFPFDFVENRPPKKKMKVIRHKWTYHELQEIDTLFAECLADGITPRKKDVMEAKKKSLENKGTLHEMHWETTKKKVNNIIMNRRRKVSV